MTGAAGGLSGGLFAFRGAHLMPGAAYVLDLVGFDRKARASSFAVTGEGRLDRQTLSGKAVGEAAARCRRVGVACHAVVGENDLEPLAARRIGLTSVSEATTLAELTAAGRRIAERRLVRDRIGEKVAHTATKAPVAVERIGSAAMAEVRPLKAVHYGLSAISSLADVTAPPYDVVDAEQRAELLRRSPFNVVEIDLPQAPAGRDPYEHAAETLEAWIMQGVLSADREPAIWALTQEYEGPDGNRRTRQGFLARVRVSRVRRRSGPPS